jgi:hypothetical protein
MSSQNFDRQQQLNATLNLHRRFRFYEPSFTFMFRKSIIDAGIADGAVRFDKPRFNIDLNNSLHLPADIFANAEYMYRSGGNMNIFTLKSRHIFNLSLSKSFLNNSLDVTLKAEDLFRKNISRSTTGYDNITYYQYQDQDHRAISLNVIYRFNNYSNKYKGQNAAADEINRLR